ncbi:MAG: hypothetical protein ACXADS_16050 [Candidatus Thorarchaeota archaeon]|jgi:hypothetical protein
MALPSTRGPDFIKIVTNDGVVGTITIGDADDKIGFNGAEPVAQPADANQAAVGAVTTVGANTGTAGAGLSLIGDTSTVNQAANIMNDFVALQEDILGVQGYHQGLGLIDGLYERANQCLESKHHYHYRLTLLSFVARTSLTRRTKLII